MSFIDPIVKAVTFFKFLRPKTFVYGSFPQSIKSPSVTLKETQYSGLFEGSDGAMYVSRTVHCKKYVVFSDGQKAADGETAYFRYEPLVWEMGGHMFSREKKKKGGGFAWYFHPRAAYHRISHTGGISYPDRLCVVPESI